MSVVDELRAAAAVLQVETSRLIAWWQAPIEGAYSLESICEGARAGTVVVEGIRQTLALRKHRFAGELVRAQLQYAAQLPDRLREEPPFALPFWLLLLRQAAQTVPEFASIRSSLPSELRQNFTEVAWRAGVPHLAAGFASAALGIWKQIASDTLTKHEVELAELHAARTRFTGEQALATELGIEPPPLPHDPTAEALTSACERWRRTVFDPVADQLFWEAHKPGLLRTQLGESVGKTRRRQYNALCRSAEQQRPPTLHEHEALAHEAYWSLSDRLSSAKLIKNRSGELDPMEPLVAVSLTDLTAEGRAPEALRSDGRTNKELLLECIRRSEANGLQLKDMQIVLKDLQKSQIQVMLRELKAEQQIRVLGTKGAARWLPY